MTAFMQKKLAVIRSLWSLHAGILPPTVNSNKCGHISRYAAWPATHTASKHTSTWPVDSWTSAKWSDKVVLGEYETLSNTKSCDRWHFHHPRNLLFSVFVYSITPLNSLLPSHSHFSYSLRWCSIWGSAIRYCSQYNMLMAADLEAMI